MAGRACVVEPACSGVSDANETGLGVRRVVVPTTAARSRFTELPKVDQRCGDQRSGDTQSSLSLGLAICDARNVPLEPELAAGTGPSRLL